MKLTLDIPDDLADEAAQAAMFVHGPAREGISEVDNLHRRIIEFLQATVLQRRTKQLEQQTAHDFSQVTVTAE